jgi:phage recombination protein Bet
MTTPSTALVVRQALGKEQIDLIKRTIAKGATDDELALFIQQCNRTGLDPFSRQIALVKRWSSKDGETMTIQTTIDGYRLIADRSNKYAGSDDPLFDEGLNEYQHMMTSRGTPKTATVTVYKLVGGIRCPFTATVRWDEYVPPTQNQRFMWNRMPYLMLAKCAESLALRKAFPQELSGLYTSEEMAQADNGDVIEGQVIVSTAIGPTPVSTPMPQEPPAQPNSRVEQQVSEQPTTNGNGTAITQKVVRPPAIRTRKFFELGAELIKTHPHYAQKGQFNGPHATKALALCDWTEDITDDNVERAIEELRKRAALKEAA